MTLDSVVRDILSKVAEQPVNRQIVNAQDVIKAVNETISSLRLEYVQQGQVEDFLFTTVADRFGRSRIFPHLYEDDLPRPILSTIPAHQTLAYGLKQETTTLLKNKSQTFSKGDRAVRRTSVYEATEDVSGNTYNLYFDPSQSRLFYPSNTIQFNRFDLVKQYDGGWWQANTDYTNRAPSITSESESFPVQSVDQLDDGFVISGDETDKFVEGVVFDIDGSTGNDGAFTVLSSSYDSSADQTTIFVNEQVVDGTADGNVVFPYFHKLYWMKVDEPFSEVSPVEFQNINRLKLKEFGKYDPVCIDQDTVYSTDDSPVTISYVPEWEHVTSRDAKLNFPQHFIHTVKRRAIQYLAAKQNIQVELREQQEDE